uniref:Ig-like domain-containing protein n=1 Tax=Xiphophorus maculatus TaxID=8083 RepID=A0A3B5Q977_XIPMA
MSYDCAALIGGDPIPSVKWMKGKWRQITPGGRISIEHKGQDAKLEIREVTKSDSGLYRCVATNKHGEIESSTTVSNLNPGQEYLFRVTAINDKGKSDPKALTGPVMTKDLLGQPAVMKCQIVGRPVPEIKWYHAGKEIVESRKYEMSSDGRNHSLSIMTDQQEDEGEYTCKAVNEAGEVETTGILVLEAAPSFHPDYPLKETYYAGLGTTLRIHVVYIGRPQPKIMWLHGAKTLENTEEISIETTEHYTHLVVKNAQRRVNGGKYRIRLHNHFGRADTAFNVEIYGM